jgi:hypothetical protein
MRTSEQFTKTEIPSGGISHKRKKIKLPSNSRINKKILRQLDVLLDFAPPGRVSRNVRNIFFSYLYYEKDCLPEDIGDILMDVQFLLEFLDETSEELRA